MVVPICPYGLVTLLCIALLAGLVLGMLAALACLGRKPLANRSAAVTHERICHDITLAATLHLRSKGA